jgi:hypothetical protein
VDKSPLQSKDSWSKESTIESCKSFSSESKIEVSSFETEEFCNDYKEGCCCVHGAACERIHENSS